MSEYVVNIDGDLFHELADSLQNGPIIRYNEQGDPIYALEEALVDMLDALKIEIFSNEHPPPHFRVKYQGSTANFQISDCSVLNGDKKVLRYQKNIYKWWSGNKPKLIKKWNEMRPSNCPVGIYVEPQA